MTIKYSWARLGFPLFSGIIYSLIGILSLLGVLGEKWLSSFLILGIFSFLQYWYMIRHPHIVISNEFIQRNELFSSKKIMFEDITEAKIFAGDFIIKSKDKEIYIDSAGIDSDSKLELDRFISGFNLNLAVS